MPTSLQNQRNGSSEGLKYDQRRGLAYKPRDPTQRRRSRMSEGTGRFCKNLTIRQSWVGILELKMGTFYTWLSKNKLCYETEVNKLTESKSFYTGLS